MVNAAIIGNPNTRRAHARAVSDSFSWCETRRVRSVEQVTPTIVTGHIERRGAVLAMKVEDYYPQGKRWWLRLHEKGGKRHEVPCHHTLEEYLDAHCEAAQLWDQEKASLFRTIAVARVGHSQSSR